MKAEAYEVYLKLIPVAGEDREFSILATLGEAVAVVGTIQEVERQPRSDGGTFAVLHLPSTIVNSSEVCKFAPEPTGSRVFDNFADAMKFVSMHYTYVIGDYLETFEGATR